MCSEVGYRGVEDSDVLPGAIKKGFREEAALKLGVEGREHW